MKENSTQPQLLLYAYNETGLLQSDAIQRMIDGDPVVAGEYRELLESIDSLEEFTAEPSEESVKKILAFAAN